MFCSSFICCWTLVITSIISGKVFEILILEVNIYLTLFELREPIYHKSQRIIEIIMRLKNYF